MRSIQVSVYFHISNNWPQFYLFKIVLSTQNSDLSSFLDQNYQIGLRWLAFCIFSLFFWFTLLWLFLRPKLLILEFLRTRDNFYLVRIRLKQHLSLLFPLHWVLWNSYVLGLFCLDRIFTCSVNRVLCNGVFTSETRRSESSEVEDIDGKWVHFSFRRGLSTKWTKGRTVFNGKRFPWVWSRFNKRASHLIKTHCRKIPWPVVLPTGGGGRCLRWPRLNLRCLNGELLVVRAEYGIAIPTLASVVSVFRFNLSSLKILPSLNIFFLPSSDLIRFNR